MTTEVGEDVLYVILDSIGLVTYFRTDFAVNFQLVLSWLQLSSRLLFTSLSGGLKIGAANDNDDEDCVNCRTQVVRAEEENTMTR